MSERHQRARNQRENADADSRKDGEREQDQHEAQEHSHRVRSKKWPLARPEGGWVGQIRDYESFLNRGLSVVDVIPRYGERAGEAHVSAN
ncbi:hypothetical protein GCM10010985_34810 [Caballeronia grimmiae]|uniref:Uncharacterized protein n=1 Tax=Caballeronia grimmiae TaxID=1071679 RepID=A0ABQ1RRV4_9BURK|nr:hypothetical protein GCM10010985_34810 [Caballeronia grimmiae]